MRAIRTRMRLQISKSLMDDLRKAVPTPERTRFVEDVLARELRRKKLKAVLKTTAGAWRDEDHPELATFEDVNRWVEEQRRLGSRDLSDE